MAKKPKHLMAQCLETKFNQSRASDTVAYESPTQKLFKKLEQEKQDAEQTVAKKQHELESSFELARNHCVQIATIRGITKLCVRLHPVVLLQYVKR